jgi:glucose-6-phosphate 1-dehydrogenase
LRGGTANGGNVQAKATTLLMFGATGDLARRMLIPSLYGLDSDGLLPPDLRDFASAPTRRSRNI